MSNYLPDFNFEPVAGKALGAGWRAMKANALIFFLVVIVIVIAEIPINGESSYSVKDGTEALFAFLLLAYTLLLAPIIFYGCDYVFLKGTRGDQVEAREIISGFSNAINIILANLLVYGLLFLGFVAFLIPGIYLACRLVFTSYIVMDEGLDPVAAVQASWRMTKGRAFDVFLLGFVSIFIFIGGLILLIVGLIPAYMWIKASFASLYLAIKEDETRDAVYEAELEELQDAQDSTPE
ncbi:MAG: hypothetical protein R3332_12410 [Pseudohongiellaceae bacterium]|nr:hypothetical protein [Pseudohongiellaceae bacterium]